MQIQGLKAPQALSPSSLTACSTKNNANVTNVTLEQVGGKWQLEEFSNEAGHVVSILSAFE